MDDLRRGNGTERNDDDGGHTVLSVVPFREEDSASQKVAGEAEKKEEDREIQPRDSFRLRVHGEEGDGGKRITSQRNSRQCTDCAWCFKKEPEPEDDTESRAADQGGKLIGSEPSLGSSALVKVDSIPKGHNKIPRNNRVRDF